MKSMVTEVEEDNDDGEGDKATTRMSKHPTPLMAISGGK